MPHQHHPSSGRKPSKAPGKPVRKVAPSTGATSKPASALTSPSPPPVSTATPTPISPPGSPSSGSSI
eukprot:2738474-Pyramimonas_sp.AAC.1